VASQSKRAWSEEDFTLYWCSARSSSLLPVIHLNIK
jgi:hypothetical protein